MSLHASEPEGGCRHLARVGLAAALVCGAGCAAVLGIDEPNVVGGDGGSEAQGSPEADAETERAVQMDVGVQVEAAVDVRTDARMDAGPKTDATQDATDSVAPGTNLVTNGDFSMGQNHWAIVAGNGSITTPVGGQLCVSVASNNMAVLGWPEPPNTPGIPLSAGASYTLTYSAMASAAVTVDAKVGHTTSPYATDFDTQTNSDAVTPSFNTFTHPFTAPTNPAETSAGLAFAIPQSGNVSSAEMVCFESVSLVEN